jgi:hypothetical protein
LDNASYAASELPYIHIQTATTARRVHNNGTTVKPCDSPQLQRLASMFCISVTNLRDDSFW